MKRFITLLALIFCVSLSAAELPRFEDGSTICFLGNSITQAGEYQMVFQTYHATRYPESRVKFIGCGIGGDTAKDMIARFDADVMRYKPDYCFLMTGMNDMSASLYRGGLVVDDALIKSREACMNRYKMLTEKLVRIMLDAGVTPILMTPTIYDETAKIAAVSSVGKCDALLKCSEYIKELAAKYNLTCIDLTRYMYDINIAAQRNDPKYTIIGADRVHPQHTGHFIMANRFIETIYPDDKYVSKVVIDAKSGAVTESINCEVDLKRGGDLSFSVRSHALPFPITEDYEDAQRHVSFIERKDCEVLCVKSLKRGDYLLKIDGAVVDTLSSIELSAGVNLSQNTLTPQYAEALKIFEACENYHELQSCIRAIANVRFKRLAKYKGADDLESQMKYLREQNAIMKGKPWYGNIVKFTNLYYENVSHEADIMGQMDMLRNEEIFPKGAPKVRRYSLERL